MLVDNACWNCVPNDFIMPMNQTEDCCKKRIERIILNLDNQWKTCLNKDCVCIDQCGLNGQCKKIDFTCERNTLIRVILLNDFKLKESFSRPNNYKKIKNPLFLSFSRLHATRNKINNLKPGLRNGTVLFLWKRLAQLNRIFIFNRLNLNR